MMARRKGKARGKGKRKPQRARPAGRTRRPLKVLSICPGRDLAEAATRMARELTDRGHEVVAHPCAGFACFRAFPVPTRTTLPTQC